MSCACRALQHEVKTSASYHEQLSERLNKLPEEIAASVKPEVIAKPMGESFRQQLAQTGLQDTGRILHGAVKDLRQVSGELEAIVQPLQNRYRSIASTIEGEIGKLENASSQLRYQTQNLIAETRSERWTWKLSAALFLFTAGLLLGIFLGTAQHSRARYGSSDPSQSIAAID